MVTDGACQDVDRFTQLSQVMAPIRSPIPAGTDLPKIFDVLSEARVSAAPVVEGDRLVGVITRKGALRSALYLPAVNARRAPAHLGRGRHQRRRRGQGGRAAASGVDVLVVDTAHGHQEKAIEAVRAVRSVAPGPAPVVAGERGHRRRAPASSSRPAPTS